MNIKFLLVKISKKMQQMNFMKTSIAVKLKMNLTIDSLVTISKIISKK